MRIRRAIAALTVLFAACFGYAGGVSAHVEESNAGVSAVMHIYPDDNPEAGKPTDVQFAFGGRDFTVADCECRLVVRSGGAVVSESKLEPLNDSTSRGRTSVTFPSAGVYGLEISGNASQPFVLTYDIRVSSSGERADASRGIEVLSIGAAGFVVLGMVAHHNIVRGMRYTKPKPQNKEKS